MWMPINTAPKDGSTVRLRDKDKRYDCVMSWNKNKKMWTGMAYGILGASKTYWDEDFCPIAEWSHVD